MATMAREAPTAAQDAKPHAGGSIPVPRSMPVRSFYAATFAVGMLVGMALAMYWRA